MPIWVLVSYNFRPEMSKTVSHFFFSYLLHTMTSAVRPWYFIRVARHCCSTGNYNKEQCTTPSPSHLSKYMQTCRNTSRGMSYPLQFPGLEKSYLQTLCIIVSLTTVAFIIDFLSSRFQKSVVNSIFLKTFWLSSLWAGRSCSLSIYKRTKGFHRLAALPTHLGNIAGREMLLKHKIH